MLAALLAAASAWDFSPSATASVLRAGTALRAALVVLIVAWAVVSLAGLPPLADPAIAEQASGPLVVIGVVGVVLYVAAAVRYYLLYRQRRSVMLLSILTAYVLLAEAMVAVVLATSWHLSWWEWHVLMAAAFGYVGYSAYADFRREGKASGLFDAIATEQTLQEIRAEYGGALESLVNAVKRQEVGELSTEEMGLLTAGLASRFGLTEGQTAVLGRAAAALRAEREQIGRLDALVAVGHESRVRLDERDLLRRVVRRVGSEFGRDGLRVGLLTDGHLEFPAELSTDSTWQVDGDLVGRTERSLDGHVDPFVVEGGMLGFPLTVKDHPAGVLLSRPTGELSERDRTLLASLASQLSIGLENARLYHQLDGLFHQFMSPDVATALLADPERAALGGAVVDVTAVFADLRGFTGFSERSTPEEIVAMLNRYFEVAAGVILAEGGTVVQFVGDAIMALFNAPARQPDHPLRAARAALALQERVEGLATSHEGWPRFRVGINTGPALVGNIGSEELRNFNAMGDAVNVAARLESMAEPGQVVVGESTRRCLPAATECEALGERAVKGRAELVVAHRLIRLPS